MPPAESAVSHHRLTTVTRHILAGDGVGRSAPLCTRSVRTIAQRLLIDDDRVLTPKQVRQAFPAPSHQAIA